MYSSNFAGFRPLQLDDHYSSSTNKAAVDIVSRLAIAGNGIRRRRRFLAFLPWPYASLLEMSAEPGVDAHSTDTSPIWKPAIASATKTAMTKSKPCNCNPTTASRTVSPHIPNPLPWTPSSTASTKKLGAGINAKPVMSPTKSFSKE